MHANAQPTRSRGLAPMLGWRRLAFTLGISTTLGLLIPYGWSSGPSFLARTILLGLVAMLIFGVFEQWPRRLPRWFARWVLQVVGIAATMPLGAGLIYWLWAPRGAPPFYEDPHRMNGFLHLAILGALVAPWAALAALVRQKDALARHQALTFELERSNLERQATEARLRLLQAQVAPHFLFNTLANIQALVDAGSPRASGVLRTLVGYLRASIPRLHEPVTTLGQELEHVQAYLELMHMRMPDRLQFSLDVDDTAKRLHCPPVTLLTLVENAVHHGIDPSEEGGRIDIRVRRRGDRCFVHVGDTGAGLVSGGNGTGTGLSSLRERLRLTFGGDAELSIEARQPHGVNVELQFPAREVAP